MENDMMKLVAAGIACIGMIGAAIGVGLIFAALINGMARNPSIAQQLRTNAFIGAGMAEALGLIAAVVAFMAFFA